MKGIQTDFNTAEFKHFTLNYIFQTNAKLILLLFFIVTKDLTSSTVEYFILIGTVKYKI